jgi:phenylalanyl-tRNA synthetase beta chain
MKIPLSWLKEYISLEIPAQQIADTLTLAGLEVEKIDEEKCEFSDVVVAKVLAVKPHPNADRLQVASVTDGQDEWQVVCGAPNCRAGLITALAKIGAELKDETGKAWKIKKSKIRDVESSGMLCSAKELALSEEDGGIIEFSDDIALGTDVANLYADTVFDISLTPNLGHCMSVLGIARELSAFLNIPYKKPTFNVQETLGKKIESAASVTIEDPGCKRYTCRVIENVKIAPSPFWMRRRLELSGVKSINNVVDVTNYLLIGWGQPMHVFDYDKTDRGQIIVTTKTTATEIATLDHETYPLKGRSLLIADPKRPLALAGVLGGIYSAVTNETKKILIEAAQFSQEMIRLMIKDFQRRTEGASRHEKGIDPEMTIDALNYAASLMHSLAGGDVFQGVIDQRSTPYKQKVLECRISRLNSFLGIHLSQSEIVLLFKRLEIIPVSEKENVLTLQIPSYRNDINIEVDLFEEIARLYGFNHIDKHAAKYVGSSLGHTPLYHFEKRIRASLVSEGLTECLTCDLISPQLSELSFEKELNSVEVLHPSSVDQSILRTSLLPGLLQVIKFNVDRKNHDISAFEIGKIHFKYEGHFKEQLNAAIILRGKNAPHHHVPKPRDVDFFDLKGIVENLIDSLGIGPLTFEPSHLADFHPFRQARIKYNDISLGVIGEVHPAHVEKMAITGKVYYSELNLHDLFHYHIKDRRLSPISPFPSSERDWTVRLKEKTAMSEIETALTKVRSPLLEHAYLLDIYTGEKAAKGFKNVTFRFIYRDFKKTISTEEVEKEHTRIISEVEKALT